MDHDAFVAVNFGVNDNDWNQFWRKCFVTNEHHTLKVLLFQKRSRHELHIIGQSSGGPGRTTFHTDWSSLKKIYHMVVIKCLYKTHCLEIS